ncbi:MAG: hypothetical protein EBU81_04620 [Proteobacteria bacterium]|nr:hypothetical protein [Pseudomonadota bacterium]
MNIVCQVCHGDGLEVVLDLGLQPSTERLLEPFELGDDEPKLPLRLGFCPRCRLAQRADQAPQANVESTSLPPSPSDPSQTRELQRFLSGLKGALQPRSAAVVHFPDVTAWGPGRLIEAFASRQNLMLTVAFLQQALHQQGLEAFQVEQCPAEPGLIRVFIGHPGDYPVGDSVARQTGLENERGLGDRAFWSTLAQEVQALRDALLSQIREIRDAGQRLCGYGTSPAGQLLLNHGGLGREGFDALDFVLDPTGRSTGRITPGSHLPLLPVEELEKRFIKVVLLLDSGLEAEALARTESWRAQGGRILNPWVRKKVQIA